MQHGFPPNAFANSPGAPTPPSVMYIPVPFPAGVIPPGMHHMAGLASPPPTHFAGMPLVAGLPTRLPGTATPIFGPPFPGGIPSPQPSTAAAAVPPAGFPRLTSAPHLKHALSPPPFKVIPGGGDPGARTYSGTGNLSGRGFGKLSKKEMAPGPAKANKKRATLLG